MCLNSIDTLSTDEFKVIRVIYAVSVHSGVATRRSRISPECGPRWSLARVLAKRGYNKWFPMMPKPPIWLSCCLIAAFAALNLVSHGVTQEPAGTATKAPPKEQPMQGEKGADAPPTIAVVEARERAKMLHEIYETTLRTIHSRYFKDNGSVPIPSRVMEDVFSRVSRKSTVTARWIAVNTQAMSLEHEPEDDFEKEAARTLGSGGQEFERIENGTYRRATPIILFDSCLKCHAPPPIRVTNARYAGLVISMPVNESR
ncbi:MAG: hypothetical protein JWN70_1472 [Planctomycetaceae bacterium]|nr:hypothetical protein [Planctomycetaceae bacterium]